MVDQQIHNRIVEKMLRKRVIGKRNMTVEGVGNMALASHEQGQGKQAIDEMIAEPDGPIGRYGGTRNAVRLVSVEAAVAYLRSNDGNVPFGVE